MILNSVIKQLDDLKTIPNSKNDKQKHVDQTNFLDFLVNTTDDDVPLCILDDYIFLYSLIVPEKLITRTSTEDLLKWEVNLDESWGWGYSYAGGMKKPQLFPPFDTNSSIILRSSSPILYLRSFEGAIEKKSYFELDQKLSHLIGIHYEDSLSAYCRLNDDGDVEQVSKIIVEEERKILTLKKEDLDFYLFLTKSVLVRCFDRTVTLDKYFGWDSNTKVALIGDQKCEVFANRGIHHSKDDKPVASYMRGFQIIRCSSKESISEKITNESEDEREYVSFIAHDWKNKEIREISSNPKKLGNYFVESDMPFGTSPAFFNAEVLMKYKQNPEKYRLTDRRIVCRNSWELQTFDINEAGQVHTYMVYLSRLPYKEQLHWKQYNEEPKSGISKRAYVSDFLGQFPDKEDVLSGLIQLLQKLEKTNPHLWNCKEPNLFDNLHKVATNNLKEWTDEMHTLDKLVIEGFNKKYIKNTLEGLNRYHKESDDALGSILLLEKLLIEKCTDEHFAKEIIKPLSETHFLRTKFSGHASTEKNKIYKNIIKTYKNLQTHFETHLENVKNSIERICNTLG